MSRIFLILCVSVFPLSGCTGAFQAPADEVEETAEDTGDPWIDTACDECVEICDDGEDNDRDNRVDCEDPDCDGDPACAEICDDGIDNDADGRVDCEDSDCAGSAHCVEICDDGVDNDGDGLVDCEDGDCAGFAHCTEICTDGIDNDGDGMIDCADDECWGPECHDSGVTAWVDGGRAVVRNQFKMMYRFSSVCGSVEWSRKGQASGTAVAVTGKVRANPKGATGSVECNWKVDRAEFAHRSSMQSFPTFRSTSVTDVVTRTGVSVDPGCGIAPDATWFLPERLRPTGGSVMTSGYNRWYSGSWAGSTRDTTFGYDFSCSSFWSSGRTTATFEPLFRASSVYTRYP